MSAKTVAAFLCGALAASAGTAAALTNGHVFLLKDGDEAKYGTITCQAHLAYSGNNTGGHYSEFGCFGVKGYTISYSPHEVRVRRLNAKNVAKTVFLVDPSARQSGP